MTTNAMTITTPPQPGFWRRYGAMWASAPREFVAILALGVIGYAAFGLMWGLFSAGIGLLFALLIGVFVFVGAFYAARWIGEAELAIIEWTGRPRIPRPAWKHVTGFFPWLRSLFGSPHYWLYFANYLLPQFVLGIVTVTLAATAVGIAVGGTLWIAWGWAVPMENSWLERTFWGGALTVGILRTVLGLVVLFALPFILRGLIWAHWGLARLMLGAFRTEALAQELAGAQASRAAAVSAEDTALRRLERDIHDGPQQRLIRLQMDLASADRRMSDSPEEARDLIASATEQAREALEELRALSRGFAPPILLDRGLIAALESAATRSAVPVDIISGLPAGTPLPPEIERNAYFIASEGLVNAVKHASAKRIGIAITLAASGHELTITVTDDGIGGAKMLPGHGLAGLEERIAGLGGTFSMSSPEGGPTVLTSGLPW